MNSSQTTEFFSKAAFDDADVDFTLDVMDIKVTEKRDEVNTRDVFTGIIPTAVK